MNKNNLSEKMNHWAFAIIQLLKVRCQNDRRCDVEAYLKHLMDSTYIPGEKCITTKPYRAVNPLTKITYRGLELNFSVMTDTLYSYTVRLTRVHEEDHYRLSEESEALQKRLV